MPIFCLSPICFASLDTIEYCRSALDLYGSHMCLAAVAFCLFMWLSKKGGIVSTTGT